MQDSYTLKILGCGTSTGVPIPGCRCEVCTSGDPKNERLRTSAVIKINGSTNILIDASADLRQQALKWDVRHVEAVIFTHAHADHIGGIDDLRCFNFVSGKEIPCYGSEQTLKDIMQRFGYIFSPSENYEGGLLSQLSPIPFLHGQELVIRGMKCIPFTLHHGRLLVSGFRIGELAYATDCKHIPEDSREILKGIRLLVLDGLMYKPHNTHFTIPEAIQVSRELGVEQTWLTHMTHSVDYKTVSAELPPGVSLAYDGLEIEFKGYA